jgi:hypothetical protein
MSEERATKHPTPYVPVDVLGGRLVRVCPECHQQIGERTDDEGVVSNHFAEHYETEHRQQEPERVRGYLLAASEFHQRISHIALKQVKKQLPEMDWQVVARAEDLPEGAPVLLAEQVLTGSWARETQDPLECQIRWYRREGDRIVFVPTPEQLGQWEQFRAACNVRAPRGVDNEPKLTAVLDAFDACVDAAQQLAKLEFYSGATSWMATLKAPLRNDALKRALSAQR